MIIRMMKRMRELWDHKVSIVHGNTLRVDLFLDLSESLFLESGGRTELAPKCLGGHCPSRSAIVVLSLSLTHVLSSRTAFLVWWVNSGCLCDLPTLESPAVSHYDLCIYVRSQMRLSKGLLEDRTTLGWEERGDVGVVGGFGVVGEICHITHVNS